MKRVRQHMKRTGLTFRRLVENGLEQILEQEAPEQGFELEDASFQGEQGFAEGAGPANVVEAIKHMNEASAYGQHDRH